MNKTLKVTLLALLSISFVESVYAQSPVDELTAPCLDELVSIEESILDSDAGRALVLLDMARETCTHARSILLELATAEPVDLEALLAVWAMELRRASLMVETNSCDEARECLRQVAHQAPLPDGIRADFASVAYEALRCGPRPGDPTGGVLTITPSMGDITSAGVTSGSREAIQLAGNCYGWIPLNPNYLLEVDQDTQLSITAHSYSEGDLVLLVTNGITTYCNDDWDGLNPGLFETLSAGRWEVYVGEFWPSGLAADYLLTVSTRALEPSSLYPRHGVIYLSAGYPRTYFSGSVRGVRQASDVFDHSMSGWISTEPDFQVYVDQPSEVWLIVSGEPGSDLTLVLDGPDGRFFDDDTYGTNPMINTTLSPGTHRLWVGDKVGPATGTSYSIQFAPYDPLLVMGTEPAHGHAIIEPNAGRVSLPGTTKGTIPASDLFGSQCYGVISPAPSHLLTLTVDTMLEISTRSTTDEDLILIVSGPSTFFCSVDQTALTLGFRRWMSAGDYLIYVGQLSATHTDSSFITTLTPVSGDPPPDFSLLTRGNFGAVTIGAEDRVTTLSGTSGGPLPATSIVTACPGHISESPSFIMDVQEHSYLNIQVMAEGDTTLVFWGPHGTLLCNDDFLGLNPGVEQHFAPGRYAIWVGSSTEAEEHPFMITFRPTYYY